MAVPERSARTKVVIAEALIVGFIASWSFASRPDPETHFHNSVLALMILPFFAALFLQLAPPKTQSWGMLRAFHEGGIVLWGSLAMIFLVMSVVPQGAGIGELWPALASCAGLTAVQLWVRFITRKFVREGPSLRRSWTTAVRVLTVLYFAVLVLSLK